MCGRCWKRRSATVACLILWATTIPGGMVRVSAEDFTVVTKLFSSSQKEPIGENRTIFREGKVYDLPSFGDQVTFFDRANKQFILVNTAKKTQTQVSFEQLVHYCDWLKEKAVKSNNPMLRFCAAPQFEVRTGKKGTQLLFESPVLTYRVEATTPDEPAIADEYREFSDWYARLNAMFRPQSLLPFPRLMVNQQLAQKKLIPEKVSLRIGSSSGVGESPLELESRHEVRVGLLNQDRERIAWLESCLRKFSEVELVAYQAQDGAEKK